MVRRGDFMFEWIKKCLDKVIELDDAVMGKCKQGDLTVDVARKNYKKHLEDLKKRREEYKLELCDEIRKYSRKGFTRISTKSTACEEFITRDYLQDLKNYFESKGFATALIDMDAEYCYLTIRWIGR